MKKELTEFRPKRNREWLTNESERTTILLPKFGNHRVGRWLMSKIKQPHYRLNLDDVGSFVWQQCDGKNTVEQIRKALLNHFGEKIEPADLRLHQFLKSLDRTKAITWNTAKPD